MSPNHVLMFAFASGMVGGFALAFIMVTMAYLDGHKTAAPPPSSGGVVRNPDERKESLSGRQTTDAVEQVKLAEEQRRRELVLARLEHADHMLKPYGLRTCGGGMVQ